MERGNRELSLWRKKKEQSPNPPKEKKYKPSAPRSTAGRRIVKVLVWFILGFFCLRGALSFASGPKVIQKTTEMPSTRPSISDEERGFAVDFATQYFTWNALHPEQLAKRLREFTSQSLDDHAGIDTYTLQGQSRVLQANVYQTQILDKQDVNVTVMVRRELTLPQKTSSGNASPSESAQTRTTDSTRFIEVPVHASSDGLVVEDYPKFISPVQKGTEPTHNAVGQVSNRPLEKQLTALAGSFFSAWYKGDTDQLTYFYYNGQTPPKHLKATSFQFNSIKQVSIYKTKASRYRCPVLVQVKDSDGVMYLNRWILNVKAKGNRKFVWSVGPMNQQAEIQSQTNTNRRS